MSWALANQEMPSKHGRRLRGDWGNGPQSLRWGTAHAYVPQYLGNTLGIYKPDYDQQPPRGLSLYFRQNRPTFETINDQKWSSGILGGNISIFGLKKVIRKFGSKNLRIR